MKLVDTINDRAARLAASMAELHEMDRQIREAHRAAERARDELVSAPPPADEVIAAMEGEVDQLAATWAKERAHGIVTSFGPGLQLNRDGTLNPRQPQSPDWFFTKHLTLQELAGAFPELVKPRLAALIRGYEYVAGPAQADRARAVAEADARILELEEEHTGLVDQAAALEPPILLELLPRVKDRRAEEAERARRNAQADADRRVRETAVNERHARRVSHSSYLNQR